MCEYCEGIDNEGYPIKRKAIAKHGYFEVYIDLMTMMIGAILLKLK